MASLLKRVEAFFGSDSDGIKPGKLARIGLGLSGAIMVVAGVWFLLDYPSLVLAQAVGAGLFSFAAFNILAAIRDKMSVVRVNELSLIGHLTGIVALYLFFSRFLMVTYTTDTMVATYMGVLRALQLQSPYGFTIKPLLDQFGFSPSFYTPGVNGSFDFHLAYPSLSFLTVVPFYAAGIRDVRDSIFIFHVLTILLIFALVPAKFKSVSLAPFSLFPFVIAGSWTDSIWAFFLVITAYLWYLKPKASWVTLGFAIAAKQIAAVVVPFLLIRQWHETQGSRPRILLISLGLMFAAFMIPNIPFIIASPGPWWRDIVAPYLPNSPAQVPGGIGLSNILLDLGIALPTSFFLVLMTGATTFLLYAYSRHYRGLNSMVFAFPIFLFFFYYRSFPNYMAYWLFPLVFELSRLGGPNLRLLTSIKFPSIAWHFPSGAIFKVLRRRITPAVMLVMALTIAFVGVSGAYIFQAATPKATIQINGVADPDNIGAATVISVTVKNLLPNPISPTFFVKWTELPYIWDSNSTPILDSQAQATYTITAPDAFSAVLAGATFHILVGDKLTGQLIGESSSGRATVPTPSLGNPSLRWWILDASVGKKVPFDWKLSLTGTDLTSSRITPLGFNGTSGFQMMLNYTSTGSGLEVMGLSQRVSLDAATVGVHFNQSLASGPTARATLGARITDGSHTLYYVFSESAAQQSINTYATNTTVIIPIQSSQWNTVKIEPRLVWTVQGWTIPQQVTLTMFVESNSPGVYYASLDSINPA